MDIPPSEGFESLAALCQAHCVSEVFFEACERNLFTFIACRRVSSREIFDKIGISAIPGRHFLGALKDLRLLGSDGDEYFNTGLSKQFLLDTSPYHVLNLVKQLRFQKRYWPTLGKALSTGTPTAFDEGIEKPSNEQSEAFVKAMEEKASLTAEPLAGALMPHVGGSVLDVGCGSGRLLRELRKSSCAFGKHITLHGYDIRRSLDVALGFDTEGISFFEGNFLEDSLPAGPYDLVILSNVVHMYGPLDNAILLKKILSSLCLGGKVAVFDIFLDSDSRGELLKNIFSLNMIMGTFGGRVYSVMEADKLLVDSGFSESNVENIGFWETLLLASNV